MRLLLHGGYPTGFQNAENDIALYSKFVEAAKQGRGKILYCFFAKPWPEERMKMLYANLAKLDNDVEHIMAERENFEAQIKNADVVFFQGGATHALKEELEKFDAVTLLREKIMVAGSSAGANNLAKIGFASADGGSPVNGLGLYTLPVIPHANTWPVEEYLAKMREVTHEPVTLINEMSMIEVEV